MLKEVSEEIKCAKNDGVQGIIVAGNFNQDITHSQIQSFMSENGLLEIY